MGLPLFTKRLTHVSTRHAIGVLARRLAAAEAADLEAARTWLIAAGQIEQGMLDAGHQAGALATATTRRAAATFLQARQHGYADNCHVQALTQVTDALCRTCDDREIAVRTPEGFAWYALYPDAYAQTAERWLAAQRDPPPSIAVIGLRSIGTTLAAVAAETLSRAGAAIAHCFTVRTKGSPFARTAILPPGFVPPACNIVVDEGPGLSGSSMAGVAEALMSQGAREEGIVFFAGHANGPGPEGAPAARRWWTRGRVWATDNNQLLLAGSPLLSAVPYACGTRDGRAVAVSVAADDWTRAAGLRHLPRAAAPWLETPKLMVEVGNGGQTLFKFAGLSPDPVTLALPSDEAAMRLCRLAESGFTTAATGTGLGWVAQPWIGGRRMTPADADVAFLSDRMAGYIATAAGPPSGDEERVGAIQRISTALTAWGEAREAAPIAATVRRAAELLPALSVGEPCAGDGRLAPHEWIRTPTGRKMKVDVTGHARDHTWVGAQSIAWDVAGATVEWNLNAAQADLLAAAVGARIGTPLLPVSRAFHEAGYCAFRLAAAQHCARLAPGTSPMAKLLREAACWYDRRLATAMADIEQRLP